MKASQYHLAICGPFAVRRTWLIEIKGDDVECRHCQLSNPQKGFYDWCQAVAFRSLTPLHCTLSTHSDYIWVCACIRVSVYEERLEQEEERTLVFVYESACAGLITVAIVCLRCLFMCKGDGAVCPCVILWLCVCVAVETWVLVVIMWD